MGTKVPIAPITADYGATDTINQNFSDISDEIDNCLSRDGSSPNSMLADLDMNSNRIYNLLDPVAGSEPVSKSYGDTYYGAAAAAAAAASAAAAAASAAAAAISESNAAASAAAAAISETNSAASEAAALVSETNAAASETAAGISETNALASEVAAGISETNAAASEAAAAISESNAATSESNAATSAAAAATSAGNALTSELAAATSYDSFDDRYLGAKASNPTLDNDGDPLLTGALYWNTTSSEVRVYDGAAWQTAYVPASTYVLKAGDTMTGALTVPSVFTVQKTDDVNEGGEIHLEAPTAYNNIILDLYQNLLRIRKAGGSNFTFNVDNGNLSVPGDILVNSNDLLSIKTATFISEVAVGTGTTVNWTSGQKQSATPSGATTYTFTAPSGPCNLILKLSNGAGNNPTWPATVKWTGGTEPTWTSGTDVISFYYDGTNYYGQAGLGFA